MNVETELIIVIFIIGIVGGWMATTIWYNWDILNRSTPEAFCKANGYDGSLLPTQGSVIFTYSKTIGNTTYAHCCSLKVSGDKKNIVNDCEWVRE